MEKPFQSKQKKEVFIMTNKNQKGISLILCASILLTGCSSSNNNPAETEPLSISETESASIAETDSFAEEYADIVAKIKEMNDSSKYVISVVDGIWDEFGADYVMSILQTITSCTSEESLKNALISSRWIVAQALCPSAVDESTADIKPGAHTQVYNKAKEFNDRISNIADNKDEVDALIKEMRNKYSEHSDEISKLHDYYVESTLLADFALKPEGSLLNYRSSFEEMKQNINRAEKYADIY